MSSERHRAAVEATERAVAQAVLRARLRERDDRFAAAVERGLDRDEFEAREAAAAEDGRCAHELEITRYEVRRGPPEYDGTMKVSDAQKEAFWAERNARQEKALERFRSEPVEGPDNSPIDPDRHRDYVAGCWRAGDPPFPPGDLGRRDELIYTRRESTERNRPADTDRAEPTTRPELAGETVQVKEELSDRFPGGVRYDDAGHPDLSRYASKTVRFDHRYGEPDSPERPGADARANELFGWSSTPEGKSWHRTGDGHTVLLVDSELHREFEPSDLAESDADEPSHHPDEAAENAPDDREPALQGVDENEGASRGDASVSLVIRGDAALAGLLFDPSKGRDELADCFRPGMYDVHGVLDRMPSNEAVGLARTMQRAAVLGARVDVREDHPVLAIRWDARDAAALTDGDALAAFLDRATIPEGGNRSLPAPDASTELAEDPWADPETRRAWVDERLADPKHTKAVTSDEPWARYQRARVGDVEVELATAEPGSTIWADGLEVDPDTVVVVEVKYVMRPDRSLYEGKVPARMLEVMLHPFDDEMERYASVVQHNANPVERIRLVTSTDAAARFLGERARKILGQGIDLDVQVWSEEER
ncbi:restriction endonuclease fold toxin-2 domain-containing protein [Kribbella aluminosa]|uniref:restriction endonuclease fold toxin-2 domain-containing protein n=1 Tax=Kribbella aluminosa TaxID=416017 RepID=UPI0031CE824C